MAVLINNALYLYLVTLLWRVVAEERMLMKLGQAFAARDQMNKQVLLKKLGDSAANVDLVNAAFREGEEHWKRHLASIFGEKAAGKLKEILGSEIS